SRTPQSEQLWVRLEDDPVPRLFHVADGVEVKGGAATAFPDLTRPFSSRVLAWKISNVSHVRGRFPFPVTVYISDPANGASPVLTQSFALELGKPGDIDVDIVPPKLTAEFAAEVTYI